MLPVAVGRTFIQVIRTIHSPNNKHHTINDDSEWASEGKWKQQLRQLCSNVNKSHRISIEMINIERRVTIFLYYICFVIFSADFNFFVVYFTLLRFCIYWTLCILCAYAYAVGGLCVLLLLSSSFFLPLLVFDLFIIIVFFFYPPIPQSNL